MRRLWLGLLAIGLAACRAGTPAAPPSPPTAAMPAAVSPEPTLGPPAGGRLRLVEVYSAS